MTKKQIFISSLLLAVVFGVLYTNYLPHTSCVPGSNCSEFFNLFSIITLISLALLPLSAISLFVKENIFLSWRKFTFIYLFIYLFSICIAPSQGDEFFIVEKDTVAIFLSIVYFALSFIFILYKSYKLHLEERGKSAVGFMKTIKWTFATAGGVLVLYILSMYL